MENIRKKKMWRIFAGTLILVIAVLITMIYSVLGLHASPQEKVLRTMQQSGVTLSNVMDEYIDKIADLSLLADNSYTGSISVSEFMYDGVDYRPDVANKNHTYIIENNNDTISLSIPQLGENLTIDKNDILKYGIGKIDSSHIEPVLRAVLSHFIKGYEAAVKDSIQTASLYESCEETDTYTMTIRDTALMSGFDTFVDELYKDSAILPYISLLNVRGITQDKIKSYFKEYAKGVYTVFNMTVDKQDRITGIELLFMQESMDTNDNQGTSQAECKPAGHIEVEFTGEQSSYDSVWLNIITDQNNDTYMSADLKLDMQDTDTVEYNIDADVRYRKHRMTLKALGDIHSK